MNLSLLLFFAVACRWFSLLSSSHICISVIIFDVAMKLRSFELVQKGFHLACISMFHADLLLVFQMFADNNQEVHRESLDAIREVRRVSSLENDNLFLLICKSMVFNLWSLPFRTNCYYITSNKILQLSQSDSVLKASPRRHLGVQADPARLGLQCRLVA